MPAVAYSRRVVIEHLRSTRQDNYENTITAYGTIISINIKNTAHRSLLTGGLLCIQLFFHDFQHHSGSQFEAVLEDETIRYCLELTDAIRVLLE